MADDYSDSEDQTFSPTSAVASEDSKESIAASYLKIGEEEIQEDGGHSSPEVISGPEEDDLSPSHYYEPVSETNQPYFSPPPLPGVEDIPKWEETRLSPPRPSPKHIDCVRAEGYLSFLNALHPFVLNIIYWKDIKLSSLSLVMSLVILLTLYLNTVLHTMVLLLLAAMIVSLLYIVTKIAVDSFYNKPIQNPFHAYLQSEINFLNEDVAVCVIRRAITDVNRYANLIAKLIFFESWSRSLKFVGVLFLASYLTNYLDVMTTLFLGIDILFGMPPLYTRYRIMIDDAIDKMVQRLMNFYESISSKVSFLPKLKSD